MKKTWLCLLCFWVSACEPRSEVAHTATYPADYASVVAAAQAAINDTGLHFAAQEPAGDGTTLVAERTHNLSLWGGEMRVLIQPGSGGTAVRIVSEPVVGVGEDPRNYAAELFARIGDRLGQKPDIR